MSRSFARTGLQAVHHVLLARSLKTRLQLHDLVAKARGALEVHVRRRLEHLVLKRAHDLGDLLLWQGKELVGHGLDRPLVLLLGIPLVLALVAGSGEELAVHARLGAKRLVGLRDEARDVRD